MKQKYSIIFLAVLFAVFSCVQVDESVLGQEQEQVEMVSMSVSATIEKDLQTKTALDGSLSDATIHTVWTPFDAIGVAAKTTTKDPQIIKFETDIEESASVADFHGTIQFATEYHAFYPYSETLRDSSGVFIFSLPQAQKYVAGSFDPQATPMVAKALWGESFDFQNLCGILALQIKGEETIESITFIGKDAVGTMMPVSGKYKVDMAYESEPAITSDSNQRSVTLECETPVVLSKDEATPFYFVLPPATYSSFYIMIHTADGKIMFREGTNPLTVARSHVKPTSALKYAESIYLDLSEIGWSNCYVVPQAGLYSFDATVIGNGEYGLVPEVRFHTTDVKIEPKTVDLLWEDRADLITGLTLKDGEVRFFSTGVEGNALVAVRDESGKILWSWHLWMTDQPQEQRYVNDFGTFTMLDRNNGAIRADRGEGDQWLDARGVMYQWGRKDPFARRGSWYQLYSTNDSRTDIQGSIETPTTFHGTSYSGWESSDNSSLWSPYQKTIYDPCPVGYRMPANHVWRGFTTDGQDKSGSSDDYRVSGGFDNGWDFYYDEVNSSYYPVTGKINSSGGYESSSPYTYMWSAAYNSEYTARYFHLYYYSDSSSGIWFDDCTNNVQGYAVRCMKDEGHVDTSYPSVKIAEVTDVTSESAVVHSVVFDEGITEVTERGIVWGLTNDLTVDNATKTVAETAGDGSYTITLTGLQNATVYYVRPYAVNSKGLSYGKVSSFRTTYAGEANNLSAYGTSNCYQVEPAYCKHFINGSVKGSGYESIGSVASVEVLWETNGYGMKTELGTVIFDVTLKDGKIYFYTNGVEGNALIASKDAMGNILWSWHIWVTDTPEEQQYGYYWLLDRNLGAVSAEEGTGDQWKLSCGLEYQWGRKDPFAAGAFAEEYVYYSVESSIANPTVYDAAWSREDYYWSPSRKTVYDPCPVGYRMPVWSVWSGISMKATADNHGTYFYFDSNSSARYWYPFRANHYPGYINYNTSGYLLGATYGDGYYWSNSNHYNTSTSEGHVRCMKDEGYVDMSYPLVEMTSIKDITSNGAKFYAEITNTGIAEVTSKGFIWGTSADLSLENGTKIECRNGSAKFTANLNGLSHSTRYYVRAYATNERGTTYSDVKTFYTPYEGNAVNLSREGTANCYIVPVAYSDYVFNASVKGNSKESVGAIASAEVLWETRNTRDVNAYDLLEVGDVIESVELDGTNVKFRLPFDCKPGNALIAVKDANGTILWSWHIWVVDFDPFRSGQVYIGGNMLMDRNLGALTVVPTNDGMDYSAYGLFYQWGRKDPFMIPDRGAIVPYDAITAVSQNLSSIEQTIPNPTVVYDDSYWGDDQTLWGEFKTKYDPCPTGWRVADKAVWDGISNDNILEIDSYYTVIPEPYSTPKAYYPQAGMADGTQYSDSVNDYGWFWMSSHRDALRLNDCYWGCLFVDIRMSVRCMKDADFSAKTGVASNVKGTSVDVSGTVTVNDNTSIETVGFIYRECYSHNTDLKFFGEDVQSVETGMSNGKFSKTISGLKPQTQYEIRAYAKGGYNVRYGDIIYVTTTSAGNGENFGNGGDYEWE